MATFTTGMVMSAVLGGAAPALGQATRTWVSGVGDDANPCSRTAPCKTFAGAISKTATGGEIDVIDAGGFGAVTITKAITIDGAGFLSGILAAGTTGVIVNAPATDRVVLRNLSIDGNNTAGSFNGIRFLAGQALHVDDCVIGDFSGSGIRVEGTGNKDIFVNNTRLRNHDVAGITLAPTSDTVRAMIDGARLEGNGAGIHAQGSVLATIRDSTAAGNTGAGFSADGPAVEMDLENSAAANNATGILATNSARVHFNDMTIAGNTAALQATNGAEIAPSTDCPAPVCEAPVVGPGIGPCKRCKTKNGATICSSCTIAVQ